MADKKLVKKTALKDDADRKAAIFERVRDVVILAGAGTGKTTVLTRRFVERVAPEDDSQQAIKIERLAAVTFTRKAAGELKNRIRMELLGLLDSEISEVRRTRVKEALSQLDFSLIGTIHSFSDRLLRLRPIEARISPRFDVIEDSDFLIQETVSRWVEGEQSGLMREQWSSPAAAPPEADCDFIAKWLKSLMGAGITRHNREFEHANQQGLDGLVTSFINLRDRGQPVAVTAPYSEAKTNLALNKILADIQKCLKATADDQMDAGARHLKSLEGSIQAAVNANTLGGKISHLTWVFKKAQTDGKPLTMGVHFKDSKEFGTWKLYGQLIGDPKGEDDNLKETIYEPLVQALLASAAIAQPTIISLYEDIKKRHEVIDQLDLLIKLRNMVRDNAEMKASFSALFDHLFVDEFQDTDPIQAEIILALCERKGSLTIIGDPKQSIYRFRRADISIFAETIAKLEKRGALRADLKVNFRSRPGLIRAFNEVFPSYFGTAPEDQPKAEFDPKTGWVAYSSLESSPDISESGTAAVRILRLKSTGAEKVEDGRPQEARLAARHIAWLLDSKCELRIRDEDAASKAERRIQGKDIAVLAQATTNIKLLVSELRTLGIEVHVTGGKEFATNPLLRRYILVLNAVAERSDGIAMLALHQFPFSSVTALDAATQAGDDPLTSEGALRGWLTQLRKERFGRPILHTALDVIEQTLALRMLGLGLNGDGDLATLYRFANIFASTAREKGWDFDETARWAREWIDQPMQLNAPATESDRAVRILTIHQSKGLEFPVVYLFDGYSRDSQDRGGAYRVSADGKEWLLSVGTLSAVFNPNERSPNLKELEGAHNKEEQKRLHYVAATRAKDFLIIPIPDPVIKTSLYTKVWGNILAAELGKKKADDMEIYPARNQEEAADTLLPFEPRKEWLEARIESVKLPSPPTPEQLALLSAPATRFTSVSAESHDAEVEISLSQDQESGQSMDAPPIRLASGGAELGTAVHRTAYLILASKMGIDQAISVAADESGKDLEPALIRAHIQNVMNYLETQGYMDSSWQLLSEYPFVLPMTDADGAVLLRGVIDLLLIKGSEAHIIDYKSDGKALDQVTKAQYLKQISLYEKAVRELVPAVKTIQAKLLMTATGQEIRS